MGLKNRTRRSVSIPRKLARDGQLHLLPLYYLLRLSYLAKEGVDNSGSYRFADHIYLGRPIGRTPLGRWIDARLLEMPAARAFRCRYQMASEIVLRSLGELVNEASAESETTRPTQSSLSVSAGSDRTRPAESSLRVLAIPCGIPRDILEVTRALQHEQPSLLRRLEYCGMDLDPRVLRLANTLLRESGLREFRLHCGNALFADDYPRGPFRLVISTGLGEFLSDDELAEFYGHIYHVLEDGGLFYTSASARGRGSDTLLRIAEILPQYRAAAELEPMIRRYPWRRVTLTQHSTGLQTFVEAIK
jgi:SAM-dependent methyltransferase